MVGPAEFILAAGYGVVMMDARAHGESGGSMATYGYLERYDERVIVDALEATDRPAHIFALGESMGRLSRCNPPPSNHALMALSRKGPFVIFAK